MCDRNSVPKSPKQTFLGKIGNSGKIRKFFKLSNFVDIDRLQWLNTFPAQIYLKILVFEEIMSFSAFQDFRRYKNPGGYLPEKS